MDLWREGIRCRTSTTSQLPPDRLVLTRESPWQCDSHREIYERVIHVLDYDPYHVYEVRVTETAIEVASIDFEDPDWPIVTRLHLRLAHDEQRGDGTR